MDKQDGVSSLPNHQCVHEPLGLISVEPSNVPSESSMGVYLCLHACVSGLSSHSSASTSYSCLSLPLSLHLSFFLFPASLSPVHLSLLDSSHYCLGTSSTCPAKARHWNGIWERGSVWEIVNEERKGDADREWEKGKWGIKWEKRRKKTKKQSDVREQGMLQHN